MSQDTREKLDQIEPRWHHAGLTPGVSPVAETETINARSALYGVLRELMLGEQSFDQLKAIAESEHQLRNLPRDLPPADLQHLAHLSVEFAEPRVRLLAALNLTDDAHGAFRDALAWAASADEVIPSGRYSRRLLFGYGDWLAATNADQTMRTHLPLIAEDTTEVPDADSLALQCLPARFFARFGDRLEAGLHAERMKTDLAKLDFKDSVSGDYRDVLSTWIKRARAAST